MWTPTIALLPGALTIYLGFDGGGYFPPATGVACGGARDRARPAADARRRGRSRASAWRPASSPRAIAPVRASGRWCRARGPTRPRAPSAEFDRALLYMLMLALLATLPRTTADGAHRPVRDRGRRDVRVPRRACSRACCRTCSRSRRTSSTSGSRIRSPTGTASACSPRSRSSSPRISRARRASIRPRASRRAAVLPLLAATLFFTFSRASIVVMVVGVVGYVVLARPRGFLPGADRGRCRPRRSPSSGPTTRSCSPGRIRPRPRRSTRATRSSSCWCCARSRRARRATR